MKYRVLVEQDEDGMFIAEVPSLPGCVSQAKTRSEAMANIQEAIQAYLESLSAHDEPIPPSINGSPSRGITFGVLTGRVEVSDDFDAPLPDDVLAALEDR